VDRGEGLLDRPQRGRRFFDEERQDVALDRRHLHAGDHLEAVTALRTALARLPGAAQAVVVGDGDQVEVRLRFDVVQQLRNLAHGVAVCGVDVQVGLAH